MHEQERQRRLQDRQTFQGYLDEAEQGYYDKWSQEERTTLIRRAIDSIFSISRSIGDLPDPGNTGEGEPFTRILRRLLQASSGPCATCRYYRCSYCGNCHNPYCRAYQNTCSDTR